MPTIFKALGGTIVTATASDAKETSTGWTLSTDTGAIPGETLIVTLGPWAGDFTKKLGYRMPMAVKRGYHMHFAIAAEDTPSLPIIDAEAGVAISPMTRGLRMTTAIEFAGRDAKPNYRQINLGERATRELFTIGERLDNPPGMVRAR